MQIIYALPLAKAAFDLLWVSVNTLGSLNNYEGQGTLFVYVATFVRIAWIVLAVIGFLGALAWGVDVGQVCELLWRFFCGVRVGGVAC